MGEGKFELVKKILEISVIVRVDSGEEGVKTAGGTRAGYI